ncbi:hypothetical protein HQ524_03840 [Candidatus Uhrbacteria bacterium]|nr:hypothetical protein [Candidatus Uhrbacteria bacterium]
MAASTTKSLPTFSEVLSTVWNGYTSNQTVIWKIVAPYVAVSALQGLLIAIYPEPIVATMVGVAMIGITIWVSLVLMRLMYQITMTGKANEEAAKKDIIEVLWPYIGVSIVVDIMVMLGFVAFIVPGIILALMYFGASYAAVLDKKGVGDSMKYSLKITSGRKGNMFALLLSLGIVVGLIYMISIGITGFVLSLVGGLIGETWSHGLPLMGQSLIDGVLLPVTTGIGVMIYGHLKKLAK